MHWYNGSIAEAVTLSKQKNAIFVVFVEGDNELSVEMASTIDKEVVLERLADQNNFLAVKLKSGTTNYSHFAQLYQLVPVPSLFFIGRNGAPLEVVCAGVAPENLAERIDRILQEHHRNKPPSIAASTSFSQAQSESANLLLAEASSSQTSQKSDKDEDKRTNEDAGLEMQVQERLDSCNQLLAPNSTSQSANILERPVKNKVLLSKHSTFIEKRTSLFEKKNEREEPDDKEKGIDSVNQSGTVKTDKNVKTKLIITKQRSFVEKRMSAFEKRLQTSQVDLEAHGSARKIQKTELPAKTSAPIPNLVAEGVEKSDLKGDDVAGGAGAGAEFEVVCRGDVCERRVKEAGTSQPQNTQAETTPDIDDKLERARLIIEAKNKEKQEKEKELERQKELERRAAGQGVAELKRWQQDQELKQIQEERKREKQESRLARERVLEQIRQDRAERRARDAPPPPPPATTTTTTTTETRRADPLVARVSLKLPDGVSHAATFPPDATVQQLHKYLQQNLHLTSFSLWTAFPRRELLDPSATLLELELVPSAALLVLPRTQPAAVANNSWANVVAFLSQLFTSMVLSPFTALSSWLRARFPPRASGDTPRPAAPPARTPRDAYRRKNNVHRINRDPGNDDNNTWNGNSTQQM